MKPYQIFNKHFQSNNIKEVFESSIQNKPSVGIDAININRFNKESTNEIEIINRKVMNDTFDFSFYKEKLISKGRKKYPRVLSIPTIRDKIVLKVISNILYEMFESELSNELIHTKIDNIKKSIESKKYDSYIKIDIENFYPSINHKVLMKFIHKKTKKKEFTNLLKKSITQETTNKSNSSIKKYTNKKGVPQGLSISNILASIYLIELDKKHTGKKNYEYFRYVDDILILCNSSNVDDIFNDMKNDMKKLKLKIHEFGVSSQKTDSGTIDKGFYFLGYNFSDKLISVREQSINNLHNSIIDIFTQYKYSNTKSINLLLWKLNLKITGCKFKDKKYGWLFFFSQITDTTTLYKLDLFIKNMFKKFEIDTKDIKVKKFIRTYFEILKNRTKTNYIPNFSELSKDEKNKILKDVFRLNVKPSNIEKIFDKIINKNIKQMEEDIQMY